MGGRGEGGGGVSPSPKPTAAVVNILQSTVIFISQLLTCMKIYSQT